MPDAVDAIIEQNAQARADLLDAIDALPGERRTEGWYGPQQWSVQDVLAHPRPLAGGLEPRAARRDRRRAALGARLRAEPRRPGRGRRRLQRRLRGGAARAVLGGRDGAPALRPRGARRGDPRPARARTRSLRGGPHPAPPRRLLRTRP